MTDNNMRGSKQPVQKQSPVSEAQTNQKTPDVGQGDSLPVAVGRVLVVVLAVFTAVWGGRYIWNNRPVDNNNVAETNQVETEPTQRVDNDEDQVVNLVREDSSAQVVNQPAVDNKTEKDSPRTGLAGSTTVAALAAVVAVVAHQAVSRRPQLSTVVVEDNE